MNDISFKTIKLLTLLVDRLWVLFLISFALFQLSSPVFKILFQKLTSCNSSSMSNHVCPFLRMINFESFHFLVVLFSSFVCHMFIRMFFFIRHLFPHLWSNLSDLCTSSYTMLSWYLQFLFIVEEEETWRWAFWFMYTFESLL